MRKFKPQHGLLSLLALAIISYTAFSYPFLSPQQSLADAKVLIVEGWMPVYALEDVVNTFHAGQYERLLVTGMEFRDVTTYTLAHAGELRFSFASPLSNTNINIRAYGSSLEEEFAHFYLETNGRFLGEATTTASPQNFAFQGDEPIKTLSVYFDNDAYIPEREDRNLYIKSISLDDRAIESFSPELSYHVGGVLLSPLIRSLAEEAKNHLLRLGIPEEKIVIIPAKPKLHRTQASALALAAWLELNPKITHANLVSLGPHSRRSWLLYKRHVPIDIGIMSIPDQAYQGHNWWRSLKGWQDISRESLKYVYSWVFL